MNPVARPSKVSAGRSLTKCPKGHRSDSSAHFCPACGVVKGQTEQERQAMMVRVLPSAEQKFHRLANHLSHGHYGECFEETMAFMSNLVNGKASAEQLRELQGPLGKFGKRVLEIVLNENADVDYAVRKAAKELSEKEGSGEKAA